MVIPSTPIRLLDSFAGYLITDDYGGYNAVCRSNDIIRAGCWAQMAINYIAKLYRVETAIADLAPEEKLKVRLDKSQPIIDALRT